MNVSNSPTLPERSTRLRMCSGYTRVSLGPSFHADPRPNTAAGYAFGLNLRFDCVAVQIRVRLTRLCFPSTWTGTDPGLMPGHGPCPGLVGLAW